MSKLLRATLLSGLAAFILGSGLTQAADPPAKPKTFIVLVGVGQFQDSAIQARPAAENDAKSLYDLFVSKKYMGVDSANVRLILGADDKGRDAKAATKENIVQAFKWAAEQAGKNDLVIFGLFGRGRRSAIAPASFCQPPRSRIVPRTPSRRSTSSRRSLI